MAERKTNRTRIDDISAFGESLSDAEMRLVSGGDGATSTADNRTCDEDGTTGGSGGGGMTGWGMAAYQYGFEGTYHNSF
jgi:hypothetical protein